jgi:hypothetical protein
LGETKKIEQIHNQLINKRSKINHSKGVFKIVISIILILNIFTLLYYFNKIELIVIISVFFIIVGFILKHLYTNAIKNSCKRLEYIIYKNQKL